MNDIRKFLETVSKFEFAGEPEQKPGDQVRGTEVARGKKGKHPFQGRLVGAGESILKELEEELQNPKFRDSRSLMQEYREFVKEYGTTNQAIPNTQNKENTAQNQNQEQAKQDLTAILKSVQNLQLPDSQKVALALSRTKTDPSAKLSSAEAQKVGQSVGPLLGPALAHPGTASQLSAVLKKAETMNQAQQKKPAAQQQSQNKPM